ncbi:MAG: hypothetical protein R3263_07620 [Myxococcota bacterium]|nr:hypothetical protein [Myxococcota bacterium]
MSVPTPGRPRAPAPVVVAAVALLLGACASTKLTSVYRDPGYAGGPFGSLLVIGLSPSEGARHQFEQHFSRELRGHGVEAIPGVQVLPEHGELDRSLVQDWVRRHGIEGVIVTRLVDVERETEVVPPTVRPTLYGYYGHHWGYMSGITVSSGYTREKTILRIETNLYDARTARLVWSASSRSFNPSDREQVIEELSGLVTGALADQGLLPASG